MRRVWFASIVTLVAVVCVSGAGVSARSAPQAGAPPVKLVKAALAAEAKTDTREMIVPGAGQKFLWVTATSASAQTFDLTKVAIVSGTSTYALIGVDSAFDGDPSQFSMIVPFKLKDGGKMVEPYEQTKSVGTIAYAYTPGKLATVKVITPPVSFCLLFAVPSAFKTGSIKGLGTKDLLLPALAASH